MVFRLVCVFTDVYFSSSGEAKMLWEKNQRIYPSVHNLLHNVPVDNLVNIRQNWQWVEIRQL